MHHGVWRTSLGAVGVTSTADQSIAESVYKWPGDRFPIEQDLSSTPGFYTYYQLLLHSVTTLASQLLAVRKEGKKKRLKPPLDYNQVFYLSKWVSERYKCLKPLTGLKFPTPRICSSLN
ncbi:uncharacterized protein K452DRAFT_286097 [Aplosporella prunicola CBS 121167]|uniref:Uncharacterized protein n=1 Tax=Aplosporella prunicola CBS 121167 TaxID=1176127 RepID=A0A6A6BL20_9PEZI|nr:uncharacterized protein K452DRAFT_286097 [Aplosporella prunicola CBS 121167]KAF2143271.1 hypothetical protein K452DRAFT_286097 [Aplosporella prunicola CBS 121167]